jgi:hypothetical protein
MKLTKLPLFVFCASLGLYISAIVVLTLNSNDIEQEILQMRKYSFFYFLLYMLFGNILTSLIQIGEKGKK